MRHFLLIAGFMFLPAASPVPESTPETVQAPAASQCVLGDTLEEKRCVFDVIQAETAKVENKNWRDQTYRELAKSMAAESFTGGAIALIAKIENPDTKALTIRGIGMEAAKLDHPQGTLVAIFRKLRAEANKIEHPPSYAIALTYIAMAQALAGDNDGAWKTASEMENDALRHKAYGETAEIQAEQGDAKAAMKSIELIESAAFRNKAYSIVSKILADHQHYQAAYESASNVKNAYKKAQAIQYIVNTKRAHKSLSKDTDDATQDD